MDLIDFPGSGSGKISRSATPVLKGYGLSSPMEELVIFPQGPEKIKYTADAGFALVPSVEEKIRNGADVSQFAPKYYMDFEEGTTQLYMLKSLAPDTRAVTIENMIIKDHADQPTELTAAMYVFKETSTLPLEITAVAIRAGCNVNQTETNHSNKEVQYICQHIHTHCLYTHTLAIQIPSQHIHNQYTLSSCIINKSSNLPSPLTTTTPIHPPYTPLNSLSTPLPSTPSPPPIPRSTSH